ncbi:MAG TPA: aminotransferase class I/II-fold pyridoxal phosphate-dependent enzyme, partial [bacterium]|nr:aminotransferase class I/II-fold pyridoxal phosphate-dependent enzyme [bacterium]
MKPIESEKVRNLPAYLFQITNERRAKARQEGRDVIDLAMGNPDLPPPEPVIEKMREVLSNPKVHRYSASKGIPHLRREISLWYERRFN